ncbi:helix-turn-helix domain-containing protein [Streptomyces sp. NPDC017890]|uniref:helix-turn-helix domain-containing protein n=1 Tax=Streptomyces sp. NPDC017890 TaxID=3365015 RepID=UPI00378BBBF1
MEENSRSTRRRSELELSALPEVAALATELTMIFNDLGITRQQYAVRTNYDKSYISRFLNGRRVPPQEFIDRLLLEIEKHRQVPVTSHTRDRLKNLRASALRVYDPELFKLETLRSEVDKSRREIRRLLDHQEALELLLERRQRDAQGLRQELMQLESDWIADRVQSEARLLATQGDNQRFSDERTELLQEISRLREELRDTIEQRDLAVQRCAALEEQVASTEIEVADRRDRDGVDDTSEPLESIHARLRTADESQIYRELSEVALTRSSEEVARLCAWLQNHLAPEYATQLASDYCRQRPIEPVARLVLEFEQLNDVRRDNKSLATAIMRLIARRPLDDLVMMCSILAEAHQACPSRWQLIPLNNLTYTWLTHGVSGTGRYQHLITIIDHLTEIGERGYSGNLVSRLAKTLVNQGHYARIISEAGRRREAGIYASSWLRRMKKQSNPYQFVRSMTEFCEKADLVADAVLSELWSLYNPQDIARILLAQTEIQKSPPNDEFTKRLIEAVTEHNHTDEVIDCMLGSHDALRSPDGESSTALLPPTVAKLVDSLEKAKREAVREFPMT